MATCIAQTPINGVNALTLDIGGSPNSCGLVALTGAEYQTYNQAVTMFGWDLESFELAVGASLMFYVVGVGVGMLLNVIRKARTP